MRTYSELVVELLGATRSGQLSEAEMASKLANAAMGEYLGVYPPSGTRRNRRERLAGEVSTGQGPSGPENWFLA